MCEDEGQPEGMPLRHFPKVVVVGAGMAGLSATRELRNKGWPKDKVVLLEASDTIGGRMRTRRHRSGALVDHGAAYVHGTTGNPLAEIAREAGITLKEASESNPWVENSPSVALYGGGQRATAVEVAETNEAYFELMTRLSALARGCDDINVCADDVIEAILRDEPFCSLSAFEMARLRLRLMSLSLWHGASLEEMQLRSFDLGDPPLLHGGQGTHGDFPGPHCVVEGGVEQLAQAVANPEVRECLRLNSPVRGISIADGHHKSAVDDPVKSTTTTTTTTGQGNGGGEEGGAGVVVATVTAAGGVSVTLKEAGGQRAAGGGETLWADAVIVAVPLPLLQQGALELDPPLSYETRSAISRLGMGNYEKIMVEFKEAFWPEDQPFFGCYLPPGIAVGGPPLSPLPSSAAAAILQSPSSCIPSMMLPLRSQLPPSPPFVAGGEEDESDRLPALLLPCPASEDVGVAPVTLASAASAAADAASTEVVVLVAAAAETNSAAKIIKQRQVSPLSPVSPLSQNISDSAAAAASTTASSIAAVIADDASNNNGACCLLQPPKTTNGNPSYSPPAIVASAAAAAAAAAAELPAAAPIFLENYLWSKGVPVLTAAVTGARARFMGVAAATAAEAAAAAGDGGGGGRGVNWRDAYAREMFRLLVKPALDDAFGDGKGVPEPVSVWITSWANEPLQRGSYSFLPVGALDEDYHSAGQGATVGSAGADPGTLGSERVFLAGEATIPRYEGSMHGAYLSGVRAANDVMYAFGTQPPSPL